MNIGDGLLFELENGKPRLILLSHGVEKQAGRLREPRSKAGGAVASFPSAAGGRSSALTSSKTHEHHRGHGVKAEVTLKTDRRQRGSAVGSPRPGGKTGRPRSGGTRAAGKEGLAGPSANGDAGPKESAACLTNQQLQKILHSVQTCSGGQRPAGGHRTQGRDVNQTDSKETGSSTNGGGRGGGGGGEMKEDDRGGGTDTSGGSRDEDHRASGCAFGWLEERRPDSRAAGDAKKAQWRRDLDEQVALKQQCSAPGRLQVRQEEGVFSLHREQPAAFSSSLRLGEATPVEEVLSVGRREAQRRRWLEELDQQREEESERRRREKLLQSQTEDHDLWATHFDSMLRPRGPALSTGAERGGWEPTSSLSLVWEAESVGGASVGGASVGGASVGGASVGGASVDTTSGYPVRASHLRTMTALLDPAQVEERERRRLKQLEQQRAIEAQVEERRLQRRREEARRREELEEEERKVELERETLERRYKLDTLRERQKAEPLTVTDDGRRQEAQETSVTRKSECLRVQTPDVSAQHQPPPPPPPPAPPPPPPLLSVAPPNAKNRALRTGKENVCLSGGGGAGQGAGRGGGAGGGDDPYEAFARTDRSEEDKRRPEWNTQRPSRRFVPASQRYPAPLQRSRKESRQRRQEELLALQERTCVSRTDPAPPPPPPALHPPPHPPPPQHQEPLLCSSLQAESGSRGLGILAAERGRSPPPGSSSPPAPPPPLLPLEFIPYVRTDEVFNMDPLESADTPPPHTHTAPPQSSSSPPSSRLLHSELLRNTKTQRQQEILRGLAQLRQGLLQKQRELETDLNPLLNRHDNEHRPPAPMKRK